VLDYIIPALTGLQKVHLRRGRMILRGLKSAQEGQRLIADRFHKLSDILLLNLAATVRQFA